MKTKILFFFILLAGITHAQIRFQKTFAGTGSGGSGQDEAKYIQQTNDGGYIIVGYADFVSGASADVYIIKADSLGNKLWSKSYGFVDDEIATCVQQTNDGGFIIAGNYGFPSKGFLMKTNSVGDSLWTKTYGNAANNLNYVQQISDGGYILGGWHRENSGSYDDALVIRTDNMGNVIWIRKYGRTNNQESEIINTVQQTSDGGFAAFGSTWSSSTWSPFFLKVNQAGDTLWKKKYSTGNTILYQGVAAQKTNDGGFILGSYSNYASDYGVSFIKTDANGNIQWTKKHGNTPSQLRDIRQTSSGEYTALIHYNSPNNAIYLLKTSSSGNFLWSKEYTNPIGYPMDAYCVQQTNDGGFIAAGYRQTTSTSSTSNVYLLKTDANGISNCNEAVNLMGTTSPVPTASNYSLTITSGSSVTGFLSVPITNNPSAPDNIFCATLGLQMSSNNTCNAQCNGSATVNVTSGTPPYTYSWSTSPVQTTATATGLCAGSYSVTVTGANNSSGSASAVISNSPSPSSIPICIVSVDSTSLKNLIVWDKPIISGVDSFRIYREISSVYTHIGSVSYSALSEFTDNTNGVNPNLTSYKYKISVKDSCGSESSQSSFHRSIHLQVSPASPCGYNLSWSDYLGNFTINQYRILRDTTFAGGNWVAIDSVSFGNTAYTDPSCTLPSYTRYIVEAVHPTGCTISIKNPEPMVTNLNSSRSNIYKATPTSVNSFSVEDKIIVYPTISNGKFTIEWYGTKGDLEIYNVMGEKMYSEKILNPQSLILNLDVPNGIYFLSIKTENGIANKKLIINK